MAPVIEKTKKPAYMKLAMRFQRRSTEDMYADLGRSPPPLPLVPVVIGRSVVADSEVADSEDDVGLVS